MNKADSRKEQR